MAKVIVNICGPTAALVKWMSSLHKVSST